MKKHVIHKNQIIITSLAILIAVAGYLSYDEHASRTSAGETGSGVRLERSTEIVSLYDGTEMDSTEMNPGESVFTGASVRTGDYAATAKMNREQVRSKAKEELKAILDRTDLSKEEKQSAADALVVLTENAKKEDDAQLLLEAKGFKNAVVSITGDTCDVVLPQSDVTDQKRAQVEDIVKRKTGMEAGKIIITPLAE